MGNGETVKLLNSIKDREPEEDGLTSQRRSELAEAESHEKRMGKALDEKRHERAKLEEPSIRLQNRLAGAAEKISDRTKKRENASRRDDLGEVASLTAEIGALHAQREVLGADLSAYLKTILPAQQAEAKAAADLGEAVQARADAARTLAMQILKSGIPERVADVEDRYMALCLDLGKLLLDSKNCGAWGAVSNLYEQTEQHVIAMGARFVAVHGSGGLQSFPLGPAFRITDLNALDKSDVGSVDVLARRR